VKEINRRILRIQDAYITTVTATNTFLLHLLQLNQFGITLSVCLSLPSQFTPLCQSCLYFSHTQFSLLSQLSTPLDQPVLCLGNSPSPTASEPKLAQRTVHLSHLVLPLHLPCDNFHSIFAFTSVICVVHLQLQFITINRKIYLIVFDTLACWLWDQCCC